jgi:hypothetical protein
VKIKIIAKEEERNSKNTFSRIEYTGQSFVLSFRVKFRNIIRVIKSCYQVNTRLLSVMITVMITVTHALL